MSDFWSIWIIVIVVLNIGGCAWLLMWTRNNKAPKGAPDDGTTGHVYDGIREYNNPLPRWWLIMFWVTIVFGIGYLTLYPGLGKFPGVLGWTSANAHAADEAAFQKEFGALYAGYAETPFTDLAKDSQAMKIASRLFANNCAICHGADARGNPSIGAPNLADDDWLRGGEPDDIYGSIVTGHGEGTDDSVGMPSQLDAQRADGSTLGEVGVKQVANYVRVLSGQQAADPGMVEAGKQIFAEVCSVCHGEDGKGNQGMGAPNLTDSIWLYGGSQATIEETVRNGRNGQMPAQKDILGEQKIHLLTAYVWSLSQSAAPKK